MQCNLKVNKLVRVGYLFLGMRPKAVSKYIPGLRWRLAASYLSAGGANGFVNLLTCQHFNLAFCGSRFTCRILRGKKLSRGLFCP